MDTNDKLKLLRAEMLRQNVDAMIVPTGDPPRMNTYLEYYKSRYRFPDLQFSKHSGYHHEPCRVWTDSRYFLQAGNADGKIVSFSCTSLMYKDRLSMQIGWLSTLVLIR